MAMISGLSGRKSSTGSSPTSPLNAEKLESEGNGTQGRKDGLDWGERPFRVLGVLFFFFLLHFDNTASGDKIQNGFWGAAWTLYNS